MLQKSIQGLANFIGKLSRSAEPHNVSSDLNVVCKA